VQKTDGKFHLPKVKNQKALIFHSFIAETCKNRF